MATDKQTERPLSELTDEELDARLSPEDRALLARLDQLRKQRATAHPGWSFNSVEEIRRMRDERDRQLMGDALVDE
jgi:hypothetical protein